MNEEKIKELLSVSFLRLIAERAGFVVTKPSEDYGDDLMITRLEMTAKFATFKYFTTGDLIGLQVKCTTEKRLKRKEGVFPFDLAERTYNHLIFRKNAGFSGRHIPLILVVFVLPEDKTQWLTHQKSGGILSMNGKAYWHIFPAEAEASKNKTSQRIFLSEENQVDLNFFEEMFQQFHSK